MGTQDEGSSSLQTQHQNVRASRPPSAYMSSSLLTQQQNAQVQEMMASAESSNSGGGSPTKAKGGPTKQQKEAAEAAARRARDGAFESGLYQVERMLGQFVCPTHVAAPPSRKNPDEDGGSSFVKQARPLTKAEVKELQRASSDRLYRGNSFAASSAAAAAAAAKKANPAREPRVPPAKKLDMRLSQLRADPAAREALRIKAEQAVKDKIAAQLHLSAGKNFIAINTEPARVYSRSDLLRSYQRPSSAPVGRTPGGRERSPSPPPLAIEDRPPFRPSGAPAEMYLRPGSAKRQPITWRDAPSRPQSAVAGTRGQTFLTEERVPPGGVTFADDIALPPVAASPQHNPPSPPRGMASQAATAEIV
jgi:hypothetical protein